jgi:methylmalonyl-CoA mutase N-terminal domain/subunit
LTAGASTSNRATFELVMAADVATWAADDVLSIVAQSITGTIVGGDGATASKAISAANASGASTVTVVA